MPKNKTPDEVREFLRGFLATTSQTTFADYCEARKVSSGTGYNWRYGRSVPAGLEGLTQKEREQLDARMASRNRAPAQGSSERPLQQPTAAPAASVPLIPGPDAMVHGVPSGVAPAASRPLLPGLEAMLSGVGPDGAPAASRPTLPGPAAMEEGARVRVAPAPPVLPPGYGQPSSAQAYPPQPAGPAWPANPVSHDGLVSTYGRALEGLMALNPPPPAAGQSSAGEVSSSATRPPGPHNQQGAPKPARR
ncbi:hypothetical protein RKD31_000783 [Streptomyces sp. SAI-163]